MPLNQPTSAVSPVLRVTAPSMDARWSTVLAGAAGAAAPLLLASAGKLEGAAAAFSAVAVAAVAALLAWRAGPPRPPASAAGTLALAEEAHQAPAAFAQAVEALPHPLMLISATGEIDDLTGRRVTFANAAARELLRIGREGALLVAALRNPQVLEAVDESLFGGLTRVTTLEPGGAQEKSWSVWSSPLRPGEDSRRLAVLAMYDETAARRTERLRTDFLANASHELRTPLASLTGFIETLRGHARDDPAARERFLGIMAAQAARMGRLVDDLLSLSRIELNEHVAPSGECDVGLAIADTLDSLAPVIEERAVSVDLIAPPRGAAVALGDRDQIVQVIQNLIDNAVKYSPRGGAVSVRAATGLTLEQAQAPAGPLPLGSGRLSLLTPDRRDEERFVTIRVTDSGPGMAREHLPRLAERFYRIEGQKSSDRSGTGLGLAIVKHIVNRHRGGLIVESTPGEGSSFSVFLPMSTRPALPGGEPAPARGRRSGGGVLDAETKVS